MNKCIKLFIKSFLITLGYILLNIVLKNNKYNVYNLLNLFNLLSNLYFQMPFYRKM